ncbi:MAG TPA: c-type cytochrome [Vicinamibacterales bacterium]
MRRLVVLVALVFAVTQLSAQEQPFKNVQLLKSLTPAQLDAEMNLMRSSLGVSCDFCHVVKDKNLDFASDEKSEKKTAREMISIVLDTNDKFFNKRPVVTCNTCHRGSTSPVGLVSLPQAIPPFPTPERKRPTLPTRDEVVAKYTAAVGKIDKSALASITMKGIREGSNGTKAELEVVQKGGSVRGSTPDAANVLTPNGGWFSSKGTGPKEMPAEVREQATEIYRAFEFLTPDDVPADARVVRKDKIDDREVYILQSNFAPTVRQRLYFDAENGLLVRRVLLTRSPLGEIPMETDYSDYRDAGGFKLPYTVRIASVSPWTDSTHRFTEIHPNAKVDDKVFEMPKQ